MKVRYVTYLHKCNSLHGAEKSDVGHLPYAAYSLWHWQGLHGTLGMWEQSSDLQTHLLEASLP